MLKVSVKAASGGGIPVTGIMLWDGPEDGIASYNYITEDDWTLYICDCCQEDPAAEVWNYFFMTNLYLYSCAIHYVLSICLYFQYYDLFFR